MLTNSIVFVHCKKYCYTMLKCPKHKSNLPSSSPDVFLFQAIGALKERGGSSRQAILKYILKTYNVGADEKSVNNHLKLALRAGVKNNSLKQAKGSGASGSFKVGESAAKAKKPAAKKAKAAKPKKAKPAKKPKAAAAAKPKKAKSPKKAKAAKPKKPKTPKKAKAAKPKKPKATKAKKPAKKAAKK